jgi:glyoxylase-like metal-dependent hydrolase (beta-lactamase superfamily II)
LRGNLGHVSRLSVTQIADGVHIASTGLVNWGLVEEGDQVTLIDAGYPGDASRVRASLAKIGRQLEDVAGVLITHAHVDHIGGLPWCGLEAPVYTGQAEVPHARREYLQQASEMDVLVRAWNPRVLLWSLRILALGATRDATVPDIKACRIGKKLDLPGRPVAVATPGHTSGHTAYHFKQAGVVATGDALITGHPISGRRGPQPLPDFFSHDAEQANASLDAIAALDADTILPGHGPAWTGPWAEAVALARA